MLTNPEFYEIFVKRMAGALPDGVEVRLVPLPPELQAEVAGVIREASDEIDRGKAAKDVAAALRKRSRLRRCPSLRFPPRRTAMGGPAKGVGGSVRDVLVPTATMLASHPETDPITGSAIGGTLPVLRGGFVSIADPRTRTRSDLSTASRSSLGTRKRPSLVTAALLY